MLHKSLRLAWISPEKGYGLFATEFIPKGTITFVNDHLDLIIDPKDSRFHKEPYISILEKYSYSNTSGERVLCWDLGKYMNHCCAPNSMTTGYGFDIALMDIAIDEEVTTDYGVFTIEHQMTMSCDKKNCRKLLSIRTFDSCVPTWDTHIKDALKNLEAVPQPLWSLLDEKTAYQVKEYLKGSEKNYISIATQKPLT